MTEKVNIVLVHGAWGDGSHWRHVIPTLHNAGHRVVAVQNPLTSLADDVDRTRKLAESMDGPTLLVGHSYGGAVITETLTGETAARYAVAVTGFAVDPAPGGFGLVETVPDGWWYSAPAGRGRLVTMLLTDADLDAILAEPGHNQD